MDGDAGGITGAGRAALRGGVSSRAAGGMQFHGGDFECLGKAWEGEEFVEVGSRSQIGSRSVYVGSLSERHAILNLRFSLSASKPQVDQLQAAMRPNEIGGFR